MSTIVCVDFTLLSRTKKKVEGGLSAG